MISIILSKSMKMIKIEDLYVLVLDQRLNVYNTMWCMCVKMLACGLLSSTSACTITIKDCYSILNQGFVSHASCPKIVMLYAKHWFVNTKVNEWMQQNCPILKQSVIYMRNSLCYYLYVLTLLQQCNEIIKIRLSLISW